ncbi:hypothetical protein ACKWTF_007107 [Chironomus riparius]
MIKHKTKRVKVLSSTQHPLHKAASSLNQNFSITRKKEKKMKIVCGKVTKKKEKKIGTEKASQVHKHCYRKFSHVDFSFIKTVVTIKCENGFCVEKYKFQLFCDCQNKLKRKIKFPN